MYDNIDIQNFDAEKFSTWRQQYISIIFQDLRLFTEQTVLQNLIYYCQILMIRYQMIVSHFQMHCLPNAIPTLPNHDLELPICKTNDSKLGLTTTKKC